MRRLVLSLIATGAAALGLVFLTATQVEASSVPESAPVAESLVESSAFTPRFVAVPAHSFGPQGPAHQHVGLGCAPSPVNCFRWILQNGAVFQGDLANLLGQQPLVLVWCSHATAATSNGSWVQTTDPWGPLGTVGATHPYCDSPTYGVNRPWSVRGTFQSG
jgi:hypothetical protein